jgi:hypothetical protein
MYKKPIVKMVMLKFIWRLCWCVEFTVVAKLDAIVFRNCYGSWELNLPDMPQAVTVTPCGMK